MEAKLTVVIALLNLIEFFSASQVPRLVCYFNSRASLRGGKGKFTVDNIDPYLCTHIIYVPVNLEDILSCQSGNQKPSCTNSPRHPVGQFVSVLREKNPKLRLMISVGNWKDRDSETYAKEVAINNGENLRSFAHLAREYLTRFGLHGLDFSWPWQGASPSSGVNSQFFVRLLKVLNKEFQSKFLLSASVSASQSVAEENYNIAEINRYVDFVNLKAYNLTGSWEPLTDHHAPLYRRKWETTKANKNVDSAVSYWLDKGLPASKLNMGIPFFGNSWTLSSGAYRPPSVASGPGAAGPFTNKPGELAFYEICQKVRIDKTFEAKRDTQRLNGPMAATHPFRGSGATWTGYDDEVMVHVKSKYIVMKQLGGAVVWDISMDDFQNTCETGINPLLQTISGTFGIVNNTRYRPGTYYQRYVSGSCRQADVHFTSIVLPTGCALLYLVINKYYSL